MPLRRVREPSIRVACAGWAIPSAVAANFPGEGSHLERYARVLPAVEIDSSFKKSHRPQSYARWSASTPLDFRFAVKAPAEVTHERRLVRCREPLARFLREANALGAKLGCVLVQLPPSLAFNARVAGAFLETLRSLHEDAVALEPRHPTWFQRGAERLLTRFRIARAAADPGLAEGAGEPGGFDRLVYFRLHGSPHRYYSPYGKSFAARLAPRLVEAAGRADVWCIFDNTASGAAASDALLLLDAIRRIRG